MSAGRDYGDQARAGQHTEHAPGAGLGHAHQTLLPPGRGVGAEQGRDPAQREL